MDNNNTQKEDAVVNETVKILAEIFLIAPLKHPIRCSIVRIIKKKSLLNRMQNILIEIIKNSLNDFNIDESNIQTYNNLILTINGLFECFSLRKWSNHDMPIYKYMNQALTVYLNELKKPYSPAEKCEIFIFIHNIIRLCISTMQDDESMDNNHVSVLDIDNIRDKSRQLISISDVPMDTKANCGILLVKTEMNLNNLSIELSKENQTIFNVCLCLGGISLMNNVRFENFLLEKQDNLLTLIGNNLVTQPMNENLLENDQSLLLSVCRGLCQLLKQLQTKSFNKKSEIFEICENFVKLFHNHHMDSVRHLCKDLLKKLYKLCKINQISFKNFIEMPDTLQQLHCDCCSDIQGTETFFEQFPNFNSYVLSKLIENSEWFSTYETLMLNNRTIDTELWYKRWIRPILFQSKIAHDFVQINEQLINKAITDRPDIVNSIFLEQNVLPLETYLFVMWTIRMNGHKKFTNWQPATDNLVQLAKFHPNDDIRIMPLKIIVDVHKKTDLFTLNELDEILSFLEYNSNCQSPDMRGKIHSYMRKALNRFFAGYAVAARKNQTEIMQMYEEFYFKLIDLCISNLCPGANFSRRSISLNLLLTSIQSAKDLNKFEMKMIWTPKLMITLIDNLLDDTYEANKSLVIQILSNCPEIEIKEIAPKPLSLNALAALATSVKPGDSITAAHYLEYCCITKNHFETYYSAVTWCEDILLTGLDVAEKSLMLAARKNPLYGLVFCIRHLLSKANFSNENSVNTAQWRRFFERFIQTCKRLTNVVAPIVNSSSPEGHLPNDFSDLSTFLPNDIDIASSANSDGHGPAKILSSKTKNINPLETTTPQMILLCAWRTTRDTSLLLGELSLRLPIHNNSSSDDDDDGGLITIDEILDIGEHFQKLLSETKHRGGFEQAYVGFSKLCVRLWRSSKEQLHQCPMQWLIELIELISSTDSRAIQKREKMCATRRSAGIPYIIQGLITSELQVFSTAGLQYCMRKLITLCQTSDVAELRTHGLNILRALFRCSDLGDAVSEYIAEAIECSILGYNAMTWSERNSATLLFSALMIRIFGVQRTRNTEPLGIRNKMTGRIFFLKYPRLYDFINVQLIASSEIIKNDERPTTLHPLLILLSRLYPSALEGSESNLQLSAFLPTLSECIKSPELETRRLAVKSIVALINPNQMIAYSLDVVQLLKVDFVFTIFKITFLKNSLFFFQIHLEQPIKNSNITHGYLVQIHALIESSPQLEKNNELKRLYQPLIELNLFACQNFVLIKTYADTLNQIIVRLPRNEISASNEIHHMLNGILMHKQSVHIIGLPEAMKSCIILKLLLTVDLISEPSYTLYESIADKSFEYIKTILGINRIILSATSIDNIIVVEEIDINNFINYLTTTEIDILKNNLQKSEKLITELYDLIDEPIFYPYCTIMCYSMLCEMNINKQQFSIENHLILLEHCINEPDEVKTVILKYILTYFDSSNQMTIDYLNKLLKFIQKFSHPNCTDDLRVVAATFICHIVNNYWSHCIETKELLLLLFNILLSLVCDDECDIREIIGKLMMKLVPINCIIKNDGISSDYYYSSFNSVISTVAEKLLCHFICTTFEQLHLLQKFNSFTWKLLLELFEQQMNEFYSLNENTNGNCLDNDIEIFDKNELNVFGEPLIICKIIYNHLQKYVMNDNSMMIDEKREILNNIDFIFILGTH